MSASPSVEPVEHQVCEIWATVLGRERVGLDDDFFALGGDSFAAVQIGLRASVAFECEVPIEAIFEARTVESFAALVRETAAPRRRQSRRRSDRPTPHEATTWATCAYDPTLRPHAGDAFTLHGPLDPAALERAFTELVRRHETLRTVYPQVDHRPTVRVLPPEPLRLNVTEISRRGAREGNAAVHAAMDETIGQPFDYTTTPPFRMQLLRVNPKTHVLVLAAH
jgi:acyl carrier protein